MKSLSTGKIWLFAAGQFGWSLLSGLISNWLVYFYQPDEASVAQGQTLFIPQGLVILLQSTIYYQQMGQVSVNLVYISDCLAALSLLYTMRFPDRSPERLI